MKDLPVRSFVYYALCELDDALSNLDEISSRLDHDPAKVLVDDIRKDVDIAYSKLKNIAL